ncbi:hypothetical protein QBC40DRAFT_258325 [Triangularia verruculosa]|uniref:Uncharacterized protein n=1 Tax=Triangularia verruculosa TaxID=2587418 RepID=A0AAN6XCI0_9PEZI|nr:hypothetical protein QBC40DRAFT_258325 [Triangularia verruculosa]
MRVSQAILAVVPMAMAAPSQQLDARDSQDVHVTFQASRLTSEAAIEVWNKDQTEILGQSCTGSIDSGIFQNTPIAFTTDKNGAGTVTVGPKTYKIHEDVDVSGGISCGRVTSPAEIMIKCMIPLSGGLAARLEPLHKRDLANCFPKSGPVELAEVMRGLETAPTLDPDALAPATFEVPSNATNDTEGLSDLERRQRVCEIVITDTVRVGDGNPHQNPLNIQVSIPLDCNKNKECTVGYQHQQTFGIGWSVSASIAGWISGGFAVEKSTSTGMYAECGGEEGDYIAVWMSVGQTAYTVQDRRRPNCGVTNYGPSRIVWSPNKNNRNSYYYCVTGRKYVRNVGDRWLDKTGRAGGP